jgi:hypothetical protein
MQTGKITLIEKRNVRMLIEERIKQRGSRAPDAEDKQRTAASAS